mmetsp:Transcript_40059/g.123371  ORF Transcript_40059/g.123371 Transcript_40059/m.123371 type:complete len:288 (-) Transcript_40059:184-1047(-)
MGVSQSSAGTRVPPNSFVRSWVVLSRQRAVSEGQFARLVRAARAGAKDTPRSIESDAPATEHRQATHRSLHPIGHEAVEERGGRLAQRRARVGHRRLGRLGEARLQVLRSGDRVLPDARRDEGPHRLELLDGRHGVEGHARGLAEARPDRLHLLQRLPLGEEAELLHVLPQVRHHRLEALGAPPEQRVGERVRQRARLHRHILDEVVLDKRLERVGLVFVRPPHESRVPRLVLQRGLAEARRPQRDGEVAKLVRRRPGQVQIGAQRAARRGEEGAEDWRREREDDAV